jgi:hypothetical protein
MSTDTVETQPNPEPVGIADDTYVDAAWIRKRFGGRSEMWLHRRLKDLDEERRLPKPDLEIAGRQYWLLLSTLLPWERRLARLPARRRGPAKKDAAATPAATDMASKTPKRQRRRA